MRNKVIRAVMIFLTAGMMVAGCALPGSDSADTGRTSLVADDSEIKEAPIEEMEEGKALDKFFTDDAPGVVQGIDVNDYVGDVDTSNLTIQKSDVEATDEAIQAQENYFLETYAEELDDKTLEAKSGDKVIVTYDCTVDGKTLTEYSGKEVSITIGKNYMPEEFESKLVGMHPGDTRNITVDYEDTAADELKNKTAIYSVTMDKICVLGEFNDEFVKEHLDGYKSVRAFEKEYKEQYKQQAINQKILDMIGELAKTITDYPEDYLKAYQGLLTGFDRTSYESSLSTSGQSKSDYSFDDFTKDVYGEDYDTTIETYAKGYVGQHLACMKIAKDLDLTFTPEEYQKALEEGKMSEDAVSRYGKGYIGSTLYDSFVISKLSDMVKLK